MSSRTFEFEVAEDRSADEILQKARGRARDVGITMEGDATSGSFSGVAEGRYEVEGRTVRIEIEKKPAFVPWSLVENGLRKAFA